MATCEITLSSVIFLSGDLLTATITFSSHQPDELEWAGVQLHGHVWHDPRLITPYPRAPDTYDLSTPTHSNGRRSPRSSSSLSQARTAMPDFVNSVEGAQCIFATRPLCLAADLDLNSAQPHVYTFSCTLPSPLPPSFRGTSTRYWYLLTVCVKSLHAATPRVAHVPLLIAGTRNSMGDAARAGPASPVLATTLPLAEDTDWSAEINFYPSSASDGYFAGREWSERIDSAAPCDEPPLDEPQEDEPEPRGAVLSVNARGGSVARCVVSPDVLVPGEPLSVKLELLKRNYCRRVTLALEQEERAVCPPPVRAAFEPLMRKQRRWTRILAQQTRDTSACASLCMSLGTLHLTPDFSTNLVCVRTHLVLSVETVHGEHLAVRCPLKVQPQRSPLGLLPSTWTPPFVTKQVDVLPTPSTPVHRKLVFDKI